MTLSGSRGFWRKYGLFLKVIPGIKLAKKKLSTKLILGTKRGGLPLLLPKMSVSKQKIILKAQQKFLPFL